jgi:hypothetical protein
MTPRNADVIREIKLGTPMRHRRIITLILAGLLAGASAVPAFAETEDKLTGLERARQATGQALELAAEDGGETSPAVPPGQVKERPGKGPAANGKSAKGNPHESETRKVTGRARAAAAIASAMARENGNGFGRGHALEVIELVLAGEAPEALETDENHGPEVRAMVKAYNEIKAKERAGD